jgi:hypothetical protein
VRALAEKLGEDSAVDLFSKTLQEEKDTDSKLSKLSEEMNVEEDSDNEGEQSISSARKNKSKIARRKLQVSLTTRRAGKLSDLFRMWLHSQTISVGTDRS